MILLNINCEYHLEQLVQNVQNRYCSNYSFKYILTKAGFIGSLWKLFMDLEFIKSKNGK